MAVPNQDPAGESGGPEGPTPVRFWTGVLAASAGWLAVVLVLELRNPRLVPSWHGFLHAAIAGRFPSASLVPENPFFAGQPVVYYWFFHRIGAWLSGVLSIDPLSALRLLTLAGLVMVVAGAALAGRKLYRSLGAGLLVGWLALVGLNPLAPAFAVGRAVLKHVPLFSWPGSGAGAVETTFVSNQLADRLMSRPLLGAMYFSTDWRHGIDLAWFTDISARGLALGVLMLLVWLVVDPRARAPRLLGVGLAGALTTALNPIVGLAVCGSLGFLSLALALVERGRAPQPAEGREGLIWGAGIAGALLAGVVLALPTFYHLLLHSQGTGRLNTAGVLLPKFANMAANYCVLLPLALLSWRTRPGIRGLPIRVLVATGVLLLAVTLLVHLEEGNEHNLSNAAQVILAVPAVAWLVLDRRGRWREGLDRSRRMMLTALLFVPVAAGTWIAFDGRPPLPFSTAGGELRRTPADSPLAQLYEWIRRNTATDAVFMTDPARPVKMSGNVAELPAFTGRTLYVGQASYMTTAYPDFERRRALAARAVAGEPLEAGRIDSLRALGRPVYLLSWQADDPGMVERLTSRYGSPVFRSGFVGCWLVTEGRTDGRTPNRP
ncbi:MAG: hypothetical protein AB7Q69_16565 [Gemmatimonadales bacterium]